MFIINLCVNLFKYTDWYIFSLGNVLFLFLQQLIKHLK